MPRISKRSVIAGALIFCPLAVFASGASLPYPSTRFRRSCFAQARKVDANFRALKRSINQVCAQVAINVGLIAVNAAAIEQNQAGIGANSLAIADNQAQVASAQAGVSANAALIDSKASAIAENQAAIAANAAAIEALQNGGGDDDDGDPAVIFADDFERPDSDTIGKGWIDEFGQNSIVNGELQLIGHNGAGDGGRDLGDPELRRCVGFRPDFDLFVTARIDDIATRIHIAANIPSDRPNRIPRQLFVVSDPPSPDQFLEIRDNNGSGLVRAPITMLPDLRYRFRLTYRAGVMSAKFWQEGAPEPSDYLISTPYETPLGQNLVIGANISGTTTRAFHFDDVVLKN